MQGKGFKCMILSPHFYLGTFFLASFPFIFSGLLFTVSLTISFSLPVYLSMLIPKLRVKNSISFRAWSVQKGKGVNSKPFYRWKP